MAAKKAPAKGSIAKTFNINKLMPKLTKEDKQSLAALKKKYGTSVYRGYDK